jgi:type IV pilus assembly protein PilP
VQPDLNRPKEPLEAFPLESIQMVGTLSQNQENYALVRAGANLFRVKKGNYMGQNFGVIQAVDESQISLKEVVQDSGGDWVERSGMLPMQEARK